MPAVSAICATRYAVLLGSLGYRTVDPCTARIMARSSRAICDGPSAPISTPQWDPDSRMFAWEMADIRMKSYARVKNAANVEAKGTYPRTEKPTAAAT